MWINELIAWQVVYLMKFFNVQSVQFIYTTELNALSKVIMLKYKYLC